MAGPLDAAALELAKSFDYNTLPAKLRCAACNKLAIDAVKLPCCDQAICEPCSQELPEACPVCEHSPLSAEECKPNKSLRMTVRAFLKSEEKKRGKQISVSVIPSIEASAYAPAPSDALAARSGEMPGQSNAVSGAVKGESEAAPPVAEQADVAPGEALPVDEAIHDQQKATGEDAEDDDEDEADEDDIIVTTEKPEPEQQENGQHTDQGMFNENDAGQEHDQLQTNGQQGFGFDQNQQGFGNMNFNGNMNGFNPIMAIPNGMGMPNFNNMGMPNIMGMPGMNMDPSMMFSGGFGGGMGMNDMSMMGMGMGMGNFGGMPGAGGISGPNFFHGQGGYNNHQNFGNNMHQPFRNDRGFGRPYGRGFGRGRGFNGFNGYNRGRGGFAFQQQQNFHHNQGLVQNGPQQHQQQNFQSAQQGFRNTSAEQSVEPSGPRGSPSYAPMNGGDSTQSHTAATNDDIAEETNGVENSATNDAGEDGDNRADFGESGGDQTMNEGERIAGKHEVHSDPQRCAGGAETFGEGEAAAASKESVSDERVVAIPSFVGDNMDAQQGGYGAGMGDMTMHSMPGGPQAYQAFGYGTRGAGGFRGRGNFGGRGGFGYGAATEATELTPTPAPPINAPTGPKAMREGKPNTGFNPRLAQLQAPPQALPPPMPPQVVENATSKYSGRDERGRSRSRSRSPSKHRSERRRHDSESGDYESEDARQRRKERERRSRRKDKDRRQDGDAEIHEIGVKSRARDESVVEDSSSSRRHRDKDELVRSSRSHRERSRDRDRERRRHRHRSRSLEKEKETEDAEERARRKSRRDRKYDDDFDDDRRGSDRSDRRHSRRTDEDRSSRRDHRSEKSHTVLEQPSDDIGFKIKGSKSASSVNLPVTGMGPPPPASSKDRRRSDTASATSAADPYAEEREKRHAERELKEQQRRQSTQSSLGKRSSREEDEGVDAAPRGPKGDVGARKKRDRKVSVRYEGEVGGDGYDEREGCRRRR